MKKERKLTKSFEDYLETILRLESNNEPVQSVEIARHLNVSKPAVSRALKTLANKKYINKTKYDKVSLTNKGRELAKTIYHRHTTIKKFLLSIGLKEKTAEDDCCKIEHVISDETLIALEKFNKSK